MHCPAKVTLLLSHLHCITLRLKHIIVKSIGLLQSVDYLT